MAEGHGRAVVLSSAIGEGETTVTSTVASGQRRIVSRDRRCDRCDIDYPDPVPRLFNFNNPLGACPVCEGFGDVVDMDMDLIVPDKSRTLAEGAIAPWNTPSYEHEKFELLELAPEYGIPTDVPFSKLKKKHLQLIVEGVPKRKFGGLTVSLLGWIARNTRCTSASLRRVIDRIVPAKPVAANDSNPRRSPTGSETPTSPTCCRCKPITSGRVLKRRCNWMIATPRLPMNRVTRSSTGSVTCKTSDSATCNSTARCERCRAAKRSELP